MTVPVAADPDPLGMMMAEIVAAGEAKGENRSVVRLDVETAGQERPAFVLDAVTPHYPE